MWFTTMIAVMHCLLLMQLHLPICRGATQNLSVSFNSLTSSLPLHSQVYGDMQAFSAYQSNDSSAYADLVFIPSARNASSYILAILVFPISVPYSTGAIVWMANRNMPVSGNFSLFLDQSSGSLVLLDGNGSIAWSTSTTPPVAGNVSLDLIPSIGTLVLSDADTTYWSSENYPTHTLMATHSLQPEMSLKSWKTDSDPSEGPYSLVMEAGGLALYYNIYVSAVLRRQPYWIWSYYGRNDSFGVTHTCSNLTFAFLGPDSGLGLLVKSDAIAASSAQWPDLCAHGDTSSELYRFTNYGYGKSTDVTFLSLQPDGNLYGYTLGSLWTQVMDVHNGNLCLLPNHCGSYGVCTGNSNCGCPSSSDGSFPSTFSNSSVGCPPTWNLTSCNNTSHQSNVHFVALIGVDHFSNKYSAPLSNFPQEEGCKLACLQNCSCLAAFWHIHSSSCFHVDHMSSLQGSLNSSYLAFLKVERPPSSAKSINTIVGAVSGAVAGMLVLGVVAGMFIYKKRANDLLKMEEEEEALWSTLPGIGPIRFTYKQLHSITNGFNEKMGKGGFGAVYMGTLENGTKVAVKQLESMQQGTKEFRAEVRILGGIHHFNLVGLIGFCAEGSHRLLVYEYMANGSLDQCLFSTTTTARTEPPLLDWRHRFNIALGTARGLAYLHSECDHKIIHLDIKPQNILLDENFEAKVSDFGLSTLMDRDQTHIITTMRGTPGYLAPEWLTQGSAISEKSDVFSFGKLLMEILGARRNFDPSMSDLEEIYFPSWLYHQTVAAQEGRREADLAHVAKVGTESEEVRQARLMINTAFLCVLESPDIRPSMKTVVLMLEGRSPELEHLQLSNFFQCLHFALSMPVSRSLAQTRIEETLEHIYQEEAITHAAMSSQCLTPR